jgi:hypothetical protein
LNAFDERPEVYVDHPEVPWMSVVAQFTLTNEARVEIAEAGWYVMIKLKFLVCPIGIW